MIALQGEHMAKTSKQRISGAKKKSRPTPRASSRAEAPRHEPTRGLYGWITHTELASANPDATKAWCATVLSWTFKPSFPTPAGDYDLFAYSDTGGGGIRPNNPGELPGSVPYVHVADALAAFREGVEGGGRSGVPA